MNKEIVFTDKLLWAGLAGLLTLAGCSDKSAEENARKAALYDSMQQTVGKQQKLEECMSSAGDNFKKMQGSEWDRLHCRELGPTPPRESLEVCLQVTELGKRQRLDDEERCVKLYK
jgi:hypothetical protein